ATSARITSRPANDVTYSPSPPNAYGVNCQSGNVSAIAADVNPRLVASAAPPSRRTNRGASAAPTNSHVKNAARINPNAYALLPTITASRCVDTTSVANARYPDPSANTDSHPSPWSIAALPTTDAGVVDWGVAPGASGPVARPRLLGSSTRL